MQGGEDTEEWLWFCQCDVEAAVGLLQTWNQAPVCEGTDSTHCSGRWN